MANTAAVVLLNLLLGCEVPFVVLATLEPRRTYAGDVECGQGVLGIPVKAL